MGLSTCVQSAFYKTFYNWGHFVGRCPFLVILVSFLLGLLGSARLIMAVKNPIPSVIEQDELWVPQDAQAITDKEKYDAVFTTTFRRNTIYFTTQPQGGNVLTSSVLKEIRRFDLMVTTQLNATGLGSGRRYTEVYDEQGHQGVEYNDVCARATFAIGQNLSDPNDDGGLPCIFFGHPLELFYRIQGGSPPVPGWLPGDFNFDFTDAEINAYVTARQGPDEVLFPPGINRTINVEATYGGITYDDDGHVTGAKAVVLTYLLDEAPAGSAEREAAEAWEDQLNVLVGESPGGGDWTYPDLSEGAASPGNLRWTSTLIDIYPQTAGATSRELGKNIQGDLLGLNIAFFIILAYAVFIFSRCHPVKSRILLAISGCVSVGLSIAVAYGFTALLGFKLNPVVNVLPFVLIGIGVDDMFVLTAALEAQPSSLPVKERMARAMASAGVSITITSLTDLFAFALGTISDLPALSTFCVFAAIGIAADFLLQISFFAGFMAWDAYREKRKKIDCCPCCVAGKCAPDQVEEVSSGCCCCCCCYGAFDCVSAVNERRLPACCKFPPIEMLLVLCVSGLKAWMVRYYIPLMRKSACKVFVLVAFTAFTAIAAFYASKLKQDFQFRWFVNDDAALQQAFDIQDEYFTESGLPVYTVTPPSADFDYTTVVGQQKLVALGAAVQGSKWIADDSLNSWYLGAQEWAHRCGMVEYFDEGPLAGTSCKIRECSYNYPQFGGLRLAFPYCSHQKDLRDAGGNLLKDQYGFDIPGAPEAKYMVGADGTTPIADGAPIEDSYLPPALFWAYLDQFIADAPLGGLFASEIVWVVNATVRTPSDNNAGVRGTRLRAEYISTDKADEQVASMVDLRADVAAVDAGDSFPYMFMYLYYEQYAIITREALLNLSLALIAVTVIVLLILANLGCTLLVMLCVILTDVDILGLMSMWGLTIDSVSIVNLVLAIGLAVDYSCHVAHAFLQTPGTDKQERVDKALEQMGTAVVHGAFSTFLAVLVLSASKSYIFRIFFKQFFGICLFGSAHGLVLLPTLLSLIGPAYVEHGATAAAPSDSKGKEMTSVADGSVPQLGTTPPSPPSSIPPSPPGSAQGVRPSAWAGPPRIAPTTEDAGRNGGGRIV